MLYNILSMMALASSVTAITFTPQCDAGRNPDWNDCQTLFDDRNNEAGNNPDYVWSPPDAGNQVSWTNGKCILTLGFGNRQGVPQNYLVDAVNTLQTDCQVNGAGGTATLVGEDLQMSVSIFSTNPGSDSRKRATKRRSRRGGAYKRDDGTWTTAYTIDNYSPRDHCQQLQSALPSGSSWTITNSDTRSSSVTSSVDVSADFFEIFKASASISVTQGEEFTTTEAQTISNTCNSEAFLYWCPLFTLYHGGYSNGPSPVEFSIPKTNGNGGAAGEYKRDCDF